MAKTPVSCRMEDSTVPKNIFREQIPALARNEKHGSLPNVEVRSAASHPQEADNEDAFSDVSEASGDHLAQDLAEDTEAGFAMTGEALARGMFGSIFRDALC